jgi:hypothetical protein
VEKVAMKKLLFIFLLLLAAAGFLAGGTDTFIKIIGGKNKDLAKCIQETHDGGYIIAGYTNSKGAGQYDVYLVKIDSKGNLAWEKTYGGKGNDYGYFVSQTADGGFIVTGSTESLIPKGMSPDSKYAYLIKIDSQGKETWSKSYGQGTVDIGYSVLEKSDGGYIIAGLSGSYGMSINMMILETDDKGNIMEKSTKKYNRLSIYGPGGDGFDAGYFCAKNY